MAIILAAVLHFRTFIALTASAVTIETLREFFYQYESPDEVLFRYTLFLIAGALTGFLLREEKRLKDEFKRELDDLKYGIHQVEKEPVALLSDSGTISRKVDASLALDESLQKLLQLIHGIFKADTSLIWQYLPQKQQLRVREYCGNIPELKTDAAIGLGEGAIGWAGVNRKNYFQHGIKVWWLDAIEPELAVYDYDNVRYHAGNGLEVSGLYPMCQQQAFYEGMKSAGERDIITLGRAAFAGSQRYGAAVWSGDIDSTFADLRQQVRAGLNIGLSGIPWWTTDIGGFFGGQVDSPYFRELIVRWFQYGVFCPLFRLHGWRNSSLTSPETSDPSCGGPNEVWSFGETAYGIIRELLFLRERLRPYLMAQMKLASRKARRPCARCS
jgi:hypothetical protein